MNDIVRKLAQLGPLPDSDTAEHEELVAYQQLLGELTKPVTDEDARVLVTLFGPDDCYGLAWSLLHLIESSPGWPIADCFKEPTNEWIVFLRDRAIRGGAMRDDSHQARE